MYKYISKLLLLRLRSYQDIENKPVKLLNSTYKKILNLLLYSLKYIKLNINYTFILRTDQ